jgi:hypothetical protein
MGCTDLRWKQMDNDEARPILHRVKAGYCPERKDTTDHSSWTRYWNLMHQCDIFALLSRVTIHEVWKLFRDGGNMTRGFSERAALRRGQCDVTPKIQNLGILKILRMHSLLGNITAKYEFRARGKPKKQLKHC